MVLLVNAVAIEELLRDGETGSGMNTTSFVQLGHDIALARQRQSAELIQLSF